MSAACVFACFCLAFIVLAILCNVLLSMYLARRVYWWWYLERQFSRYAFDGARGGNSGSLARDSGTRRRNHTTPLKKLKFFRV